MKITVFILFLTSFVCPSQGQKKVLFLGNSYTAYNNLPQMVSDLAASAGDNLLFDSNTPGGFTLNGHSTNAQSIQKIQAGNWDYVVLQEQSQLPSFPIGQVQTDCFPYAAILDSIIREYNSCAETMFYMTWGRENGDASNCPNWPPVCTYNGMDSLLRLRYEQMAVDNHAVLSPVGALWHFIRQTNPSLQLYASDGSHPNLAGSYAAACAFYSTIFRKDPTLIANDYGLSTSDAIFIRNATKAVVFDSLLTWHIGEYDPVASFSLTQSFLTGSFLNQSTNACNYLWDFGDGDTSTLENPFHTYQAFGTYTVTLFAECCGFSDTISTLIDLIRPAEITEFEKELKLNISPNPVSDFANVKLENADQISLKNLQGEIVLVPIQVVENGFRVDLSSLSNGIYLVNVIQGKSQYWGKIFKE